MKTTRRKTLLVALFVSMLLLAVASTPTFAAGGGQEKVILCHKPDTPAELTIEVAAPAVDAHLAHGDYLGACRQPSEGCQAINLFVPDGQFYPYYYNQVLIATLNAGETIYTDLTIQVTSGSILERAGSVSLDTYQTVALDEKWVYAGETGTVSVEYTVLEDGEYSLGASALGFTPEDTFTVLDANFSCTPY